MRISDWSSDVCSSDLSSTNFSLSLSKLLRTLLLRLGTYAIGNFNPCSFAQAFAISYPASACRIQPVPGSFHSTRALRPSPPSAPPQPMTMPLCWQYPIPPQPPWRRLTQLAPPPPLPISSPRGPSTTPQEP